MHLDPIHKYVDGKSSKKKGKVLLVSGYTDRNNAYGKKQGGVTSLHEAKARSGPLIIGAGQGTTATHAVFTQLCKQGIKAVHYLR